MALLRIHFLAQFTFCLVSSEATVSAKEARSEPYTVLVVCAHFHLRQTRRFQ